jgi:hypothetical protein
VPPLLAADTSRLVGAFSYPWCQGPGFLSSLYGAIFSGAGDGVMAPEQEHFPTQEVEVVDQALSSAPTATPDVSANPTPVSECYIRVSSHISGVEGRASPRPAGLVGFALCPSAASVCIINWAAL